MIGKCLLTQKFITSAIDCNFENGQCGWKTNETSYKWGNWHGETPSFFTGPDIDHTLGTSKYSQQAVELLYKMKIPV